MTDVLTIRRTPPPDSPGALTVLLFATTLSVLAGAVISPVLPTVRDEFGLDATTAGLVLTAHSLVIALASPVAGRLIDRHGFRVPLAAGLLVYGVAGSAGMVADSYAALMASRIVFGLGAAALFSATTVAMTTLYTGTRRDRVMGWRSSATSLGGIVWPLVGGALGTLTWHAPFAVHLVGLPLGLATLLCLPRTATPPARTRSRALTLLRAHLRLVAALGLQAALSVLLYCIVIYLPFRLDETGVTSPALISLFPAAANLAASLIGFGYARLRARLSYPTLLRASVALWAGGFLLLGTAAHPVPLALGAAVFGIGQGIAFPALTVLVADAVSPEHRGMATSLSGTTIFAAQFATPLVIGPLTVVAGIDDIHLTLATVLAVGTALSLLPHRTTARRGAPSRRPR